MKKDNILDKRNEILNGNLWKVILCLGLPIIFNNFIQAIYEILDINFVSHIGKEAIAAVTFVGPINNIVLSVGIGLGVAGTALVSRTIGNNDFISFKKYSGNLLSLTFLIGLFVGIIGFIFSIPIMQATGATETIINSANLFFKISMISTPITLLSNSYSSIKYAQGETKKMFYLNTISIIIKLILNYLFIIVLNQGIISLGFSTLISRFVIVGYGYYDLFIRENDSKISISDLKLETELVRNMIIISLPVIIEKSTMSYGFVVMNEYVLAFGENFLASYGVASRVTSIGFSTVGGLASTIVTIVSQNLALNNYDRIRKTYYIGLTLITIVGTIFSILVVIFSDFIVRALIGPNMEIYYHTINGIRLFIFASIPFGLLQVVFSMFQANYNNKVPLLLSVVRLWIFRIPCVYLFVTYFKLAENGVWYGMTMSNVLTALLGLYLYYIYSKKNYYEKACLAQ